VDTRTISPGDPDYPTALHHIEPPLPTLRVRGPLRWGDRVAIVGTRQASAEAIVYARKLAAELSQLGIEIWSGGAEGIDAAAHEGGLAGGGRTVVVLPSGLERPFPATNRELFDRVLAEGGAFVSGFQDVTMPTRAQFFRRNKILAACVPAVVVVQCPVQSGARNAAKAARQLGRKVGIVLSPPWEPAGAGCIVELRLGATPIVRARDVLDLLGLRAPRQVELFVDDAFAALPDPERRIVHAIRDGARHVDAICEALGEPAAEVTRRLLTLVLRGTVAEAQEGLVLASGARVGNTLPSS
jgi:DNA processing protein